MNVRLIRMHEVSEITGVPESTLRYWRLRGAGGPQSTRLGRRVVYREADVLEWIDAQFKADAARGGAHVAS